MSKKDIIARLEKLEQKSALPYLIIHHESDMPAHPENFNIIRIVEADPLSPHYLKLLPAPYSDLN